MAASVTGHERWDELAAGYALHALEPEDEHVFAEHLRGCDVCARTLAELRALAGRLAYAAESAAPPDDLRRAVLDAVGGAGPPVFGDEPDRPVEVRLGSGRVRRRRGPAYVGGRRWSLALVGLTLLFGMAVWNLNLRDQREVAVADSARLRELAGVLAAPGTRSARLTAAGPERAAVFLRADRAWLVLDGFDRNDTTATIYVLWWEDADGVAHPMAPFDVRRPGTNVIADLPVPVPPERIAGLVISKERGRRMPARPGVPLVTGSLRA